MRRNILKTVAAWITISMFCTGSIALSEDAPSWASPIEAYMERSERETPPAVEAVVQLWNENGILVTLPAKELGSRWREESSWDRYIVSDDFQIIYSISYDGSDDFLLLEIPKNYKPMKQALILAIQSMLDMDAKDATELYDLLEYNLLDHQALLDRQTYEIRLGETGPQMLLTIRRRFEP